MKLYGNVRGKVMVMHGVIYFLNTEYTQIAFIRIFFCLFCWPILNVNFDTYICNSRRRRKKNQMKRLLLYKMKAQKNTATNTTATTSIQHPPLKIYFIDNKVQTESSKYHKTMRLSFLVILISINFSLRKCGGLTNELVSDQLIVEMHFQIDEQMVATSSD